VAAKVAWLPVALAVLLAGGEAAIEALEALMVEQPVNKQKQVATSTPR